MIDWVVETIHHPQRVFYICIVILLLSLVFDGTLIKIWRLNRNIDSFQVESSRLQSEIVNINKQIQQAHDPSFLEREARDRFDLVKEGDLVFVFSEEEPKESEEEEP